MVLSYSFSLYRFSQFTSSKGLFIFARDACISYHFVWIRIDHRSMGMTITQIRMLLLSSGNQLSSVVFKTHEAKREHSSFPTSFLFSTAVLCRLPERFPCMCHRWTGHRYYEASVRRGQVAPQHLGRLTSVAGMSESYLSTTHHHPLPKRD